MHFSFTDSLPLQMAALFDFDFVKYFLLQHFAFLKALSLSP